MASSAGIGRAINTSSNQNQNLPGNNTITYSMLDASTKPYLLPNVCLSETDLAAAITATSLVGGGLITLAQSFTINSTYTIPANTVLRGSKGSTILTAATSGSLILSANCKLTDVQITTALTSGSLVKLNGTKCEVTGCTFTVASGGTGVAVEVASNLNDIHDNIFYGVVAPSTGTGIQYNAGTVGSVNQYNSFFP